MDTRMWALLLLAAGVAVLVTVVLTAPSPG